MGKYFGTDGFRGVANQGLTANHAYKIGRFIGYFENGHKNKILIARDTRLSGQMLAESLAAGIVSSGSDAYNIGVSTTPSVSYLVRKYNFDFGVMISASHNPYYDNGIKVFNRNGEKLEENIELLIEDYLDAVEDNIPLAINENMGTYPDCSKLIDDYENFLVSKTSPLVSRLSVLVDCANGASSEIAPKLLDKLGVDATIIHHTPNGVNINANCGSTHLNSLQEEVQKAKFDIAFAFDGDADRCLAVDSDGKIIDGDCILYMNALYLKKRNQLNNNTVVLTVMSNLGLKLAFQKEKINVAQVGVGDKYVQAEMKKNDYSLGGEQSGHIIFLEDMNTGDGLLTMIKILNILAEENKNSQELLEGLKILPQYLKNVRVKDKKAILENENLKSKIVSIEESLKGQGRILVRASGTEPLIRVMCEAPTQKQCEEICNELVSYIETL